MLIVTHFGHEETKLFDSSMNVEAASFGSFNNSVMSRASVSLSDSLVNRMHFAPKWS